MFNFKLLRDYSIFLLGLLFMGLGVSLITKSNLGTSPISSVPFVLSMIFPITLGEFTFLMGLVFLFLQMLILGKDFPKKQYLQLIVGPLFGVFIDLGMLIFSFLNPTFYLEQISVLLIGCVFLGTGVFLEVLPKLVMNPGEGMVSAIATRLKKEFGTVKIFFDTSLVIIALVISFYSFKNLKGLREGTVISAILVGVVVKLLNDFYKKKTFKDESME